jgi:hypothetical protein
MGPRLRAEAEDSSKMQAVIQLSVRFSTAIWEARLGSLHTNGTDVTSDESACIGDDTVHEVMRKAYTWPNDPQVYGGDAPFYRIIFAPGGTDVPITPSVGQIPGGSRESGIPLCSTLPDIYNYVSQYSGPGSTKCDKPCDVPVNSQCPGFKPPAATFGIAYPGATTAHPWACNFDPKGGGGNNGVICRWN